MEKNEIYRKPWFWVLIILFGIPFAIGYFQGIVDIIKGDTSNNNTITNTTNNIVAETPVKETYTLKGGDLGEYGKKVTLNAKTDIPVDKYLYKIPAGKYKATTNDLKASTFSIVKDKIQIDNDNKEYPEFLKDVQGPYLLTAGNTLDKIAIKEVEIEVKEDESIKVLEDDIIILEKLDN